MTSTPLLKTFTWPTAGTNYALNMNGTSQYVSTGDIDLDSVNVTMEGYVNVTGFKTTAPYTTSIMGIDSAQDVATLQIGNATVADKLQFSLNIGGTIQTLTSATTLTAGTWYHVAATYDGIKMRLYINGAPDDSMAVTGYVWAKGPFYIGRDSVTSATSYLNGSVDEVRVWATARTQPEINLNVCSVNAWSDSLAAYWTFNDCNTVIPYDNSGNAHDGAAVNMTTANWVTPAPCHPTSVPTVANGNAIKLYPNPLTQGNDLVLEVPTAAKTQCYIYDETGSLLYHQEVYQQRSTISAAGLSSGVYFYKVVCNEQTFTGKFVVLQ